MTTAVTETFSGDPSAVAAARRLAAAYVERTHPGLADLVAVVVSELATNAVQHGATDFTLQIEPRGAGLRITVVDYGPGRPAEQTPTVRQQHGRGLQIVGRLAASWGVEPGPAGTGKAVWAELGAPG